MKLIFATHNPGKIKEMQALLADLDIEVFSAAEVGVEDEVVEDGNTFEENAFKKAKFVATKTKEFAVSDDSGICIEALGGQPGIKSARFAGDQASDNQIVEYTLNKIKDVKNRKAYFESVVVLVSPQGQHWTFAGKVFGILAREPLGKPRPKLPYDLIFIPNGFKQTFAQMSDEQKNSLSHRGQAFIKLKQFLASYASTTDLEK